MIEQLEYNEDGNIVSVYDANLNRTRSVYDERNLLVTQNRPLEAITVFEYDDMGDQVPMTDPEDFEVTLTYDERRRMITESQGDPAETTTYRYDGNGNRTSMRRPEGGEWIYEYDDADRLVAVDNPEGDRSEFEYDANGNLAVQTDGNQNATTFEYDELDRRTRMTYPDGNFETRAYDEAGNLIEMQDAKGQLATYAYDALDREVLREYRGSPDATDVAERLTSTWDRNNNLLTVVESRPGEADAVTTRTYDDFDRLESVTDCWMNTLLYTYDANGNRTRLQDPDGKLTTYAYDELNRVSSVLVPGAGSTQYEYLLNGLPSTVTYSNGTSAETTFDGSQRVASIVNRHNTAVVSSFEYQYDENGNRVQQIETHGGQPPETTTYVYDGADRLLGVTYPDKIVNYTYDGTGNRQTETETDLSGETVLSDKLYAYNVRSQLTAMEDLLDPAGSVTYSYDANGNRISRTTGSGEATDLTFDVRDRLVEVVENGNSLGIYGYDVKGLRVTKTTPDGVERYVYDDLSVLLRTRDGARTAKYDYGPFRLLSVDDSVDGRAFYLFDALGSVSELTTPTGAILGRYVWDAWGRKRSSFETGANSFGFTGHEHDEETGLVYAKARFYDPVTGVFLSQDPVLGDPSNPPSLHRYLYAFQNPTVYVDPDGRIQLIQEFRKRVLEPTIEFFLELPEKLQREESAHLRFSGKIQELHTAIGAGTAAGLIRLLDDLSGVLNAATNAMLLVHTSEGELAEEAAVELEGAYLNIVNGILTIATAPEETVVAVLDAARRKLAAAASGDPRAVADATAFLVEIGGDFFLGLKGKRIVTVTEDVIEAGVRSGRRTTPRVDLPPSRRSSHGPGVQRTALDESPSAPTSGSPAKVPRGTTAGLRRFVDGDLFEAAIRSDAGTVKVLAETSVSGRTLTLSDLVVYADDGTLVNQVGAGQFLTLRTQVAREAAEAGFDTLRITGVRVQTSSSANPGAAIDRVIDLSRFK